MQSSLETAVEHLNAEEHSEGYKYFDHATGLYWISDAIDVEDLGRRLQASEPDAYSVWCSDTVSDFCQA